LLDDLPTEGGRILELGTGWVHAYSLYPALLRDNEIHCFDVSDIRRFEPFKKTVGIAAEQIDGMLLDATTLERARARAEAVSNASSFAEAYDILGMTYQVASTGIPSYPDQHFDAVYSIDVLEHVNADAFGLAATRWHNILKPGGRFSAQVGIDDHLSHNDPTKGPKHYLRYSDGMWRHLLANSLQYINRLTASNIVAALQQVGFVVDHVATHDYAISRQDVHPDYQGQSDDDLRAVRLFVRAHRPS
jgi:SAM-dependent methyltransferase